MKKDNWCRCKKCGHKLFKILKRGDADIEIKCHSCKEINAINIK